MSKLSDMLKGLESTESLAIESKLNKLLLLDREDREDRVGMHGSGIIASDNEFCYRQQVLSFFYKGFEPPISDGLRRIFLNGWYVHIKWQTLFEKAGIAVGIEQRGMSDSMRLLFTPDAIIRLGNKTYVVEIKSVNTYQFQKMKTHPSGAKQLQLYMHMLGIPRGFVLCEDKNNQEIKVFPTEYDPTIAKPLVERMLKVNSLIERFEKTGKLPSRMCDNESCKKAKSCAYANACFNIKRIPLNDEQMKRLKGGWDD